jgi:5-(carboxyamino)imidazole ribonucleotide synthase
LGKRNCNIAAPRVHNSGRWTIEGAQTSQFERHIRAIAGWPLGSTTRRRRIEMHNLVGEDAEGWRDILAQPDSPCISTASSKSARAAKWAT